MLSHDILLPFEFSHLMIFGVSMFYVVTTVITAERLAYTNLQWQRMANLNANVLADQLDDMAANGQVNSYEEQQMQQSINGQ